MDLATPLPPGPYRVEWPDHQGGWFKVWGRQGTPPDFADGWAIPLVAMGVQSPMEWLADHLNALTHDPSVTLPVFCHGGWECDPRVGRHVVFVTDPAAIKPSDTILKSLTEHGDPEYDEVPADALTAEQRALLIDAVQGAASVGLHFPALCHAFGIPDTIGPSIDAARLSSKADPEETHG